MRKSKVEPLSETERGFFLGGTDLIKMLFHLNTNPKQSLTAYLKVIMYKNVYWHYENLEK